MHQNQLYLYTSNEQPKNEIKKISFTIASKRIKYLGIKFTKIKGMYTENY